jgi:CubicO group peptidase (beta-lactamase class C family)
MNFVLHPWNKRFLILFCICFVGVLGGAQEDIRSALKLRGFAIENIVNSSDDEALEKFIEVHLSAEFKLAFSREDHLEQLRLIRDRCGNAANIMWEPLDDNGIRIAFQNEEGRSYMLRFRIQTSSPYKIIGMALEEGERFEKKEAQVKPVTWDSLEQRLKEEEQKGFTGVVLIVHNNELILHKGYGMANAESKIPNSLKTAFAIGSTPIDFTKAAILKLSDLKELQISDPITKFFSDVPEDKQSITIEHLMTGQSGLQNFHHIPGEDDDYDLTWIDRDTAVERIFRKALLFPPGEGNQHSHSAWGLLAAVVEIVSKKPYIDFLKETFFDPIGMEKTGLYQDASSYKKENIAVGHPPEREGKTNAPQNWGPTSWLVMGSGGMVSNPGDLHKWVKALRSGKFLTPVSLNKYWSKGVLAGGNDRGFLCIYTEGPDTMMILCSNSHTSMGDRASQLGRALARLVLSEKEAK